MNPGLLLVLGIVLMYLIASGKLGRLFDVVRSQ